MLPTYTFYTTESTKVSPRKKLFVSFCLSFKDKSQVHHAPNCRVLSVYRLQKNNDDIFYGAKNKLPTKFRTDVNIKDRHVLLLYLPADKTWLTFTTNCLLPEKWYDSPQWWSILPKHCIVWFMPHVIYQLGRSDEESFLSCMVHTYVRGEFVIMMLTDGWRRGTDKGW